MSAIRKMRKAYYIYQNGGFQALWDRANQRVMKKSYPLISHQDLHYAEWIRINEPDKDQLQAQRSVQFSEPITISFVCPTYHTKPRFLKELVESLQKQTVNNWELCLADGGSDKQTIECLRNLAENEPRIKIDYLDQNKGIALNTAAAVALSTGEYIAFIDHDDILQPFTVYELIRTIGRTRADFIYSDEDKFDQQGRFSPHFKPEYSPDTLRSYNYITHLMVISKQLYDLCGGLRSGYDGSQDHDLALRATEVAQKIVHIPKILYHWRAHGGSVAGDGGNKPYAFDAGCRAVASLVNKQTGGDAEQGLFPASYRARYPNNEDALISVIIPNQDHAELLCNCIDSIFSTAGKARLEVLIVENGSKEKCTFDYYDQLEKEAKARVLLYPKSFNYSAVNNYAAQRANGEVLLFLNNDIRALGYGWIQAMLEHALRSEIGAVGAKLLFEDGRVQHAGVVIGLGGWADHICSGAPKEGSIWMGSHLINTVRNVSAVTGACCMVEKKKFDEVGGFDESFILCGSDVALCVQLMNKGYRNIYTPFACLEHLESETRQQMDIPQIDFIRSEEVYRPFREKGDPYYSLNLDYYSKWPSISKAKRDRQLSGIHPTKGESKWSGLKECETPQK